MYCTPESLMTIEFKQVVHTGIKCYPSRKQLTSSRQARSMWQVTLLWTRELTECTAANDILKLHQYSSNLKYSNRTSVSSADQTRQTYSEFCLCIHPMSPGFACHNKKKLMNFAESYNAFESLKALQTDPKQRDLSYMRE